MKRENTIESEVCRSPNRGQKIYPDLKQARAEMIELLTAKNNVERILDMAEKEKNCDHQ